MHACLSTRSACETRSCRKTKYRSMSIARLEVKTGSS
jgi:hypothetical protein